VVQLGRVDEVVEVGAVHADEEVVLAELDYGYYLQMGCGGDQLENVVAYFRVREMRGKKRL
jgi:hypothetical protein